MKIAYMVAVILGGVMAFAWIITQIAKDAPSTYPVEKCYIGGGIKQIEIDNKYVCFVLREHRGISCVQKVGE